MPSNYTSNYQLNQWSKSDRVLMSEFNADNAKIDAALASKASTSALNSLKSVVDTKAGQSALDSLKATVTSQGTDLEQRNCQVYFATHTGDGGDTPTFTFPRKPWVVILFQSSDYGLVAVRGRSSLYAIGGDSRNFRTAAYQFSGNALSFSADGSYVNGKGETITVFALLEI